MKKSVLYILVVILGLSACDNKSIEGNWYYLDNSIEDSSKYSEAYIDSNRIFFISYNYGPSPAFLYEIKENNVYYGTPDEHPAFKIIDIKKNSFIIESWISYTDSIRTYRNTFYRLDNSVIGFFEENCNYDSLLSGFEKRYEEYLVKNNFITREELESWKNDTSYLEDFIPEEIIPIKSRDSVESD